MKLLGMIVVIAVCVFVLTGCGKVEAPAELWPVYGSEPVKKADDPPKVLQKLRPPLYITESTTASGVKCVTAAYYNSVALSCDWK